MSSSHHELSVHSRVGSLHLDVDLRLTAPWTLLFGHTGSGKTSLLRAACGLLGTGGIRFTRSALSLHDTPPHLRDIRWAPQHTSLFPHLRVRDNITFGATATAQIPDRQTFADAIDLFRLTPFLDRYPRDLSGGERQRVSLARAFAAPNCKLMLLDEPFSGIDRTLRDELLPRMRTWLTDRAIPTLSVSHDVEEALQLQAEVVLLSDGKIEAQGPSAEVLATERHNLLHTLSLSRG